jgi:hypothetical protein
VRLRVAAGIETADGGGAVTYDLFPRKQSTVVDQHLEDLTTDVAKALKFMAPVVGDVLGLKPNIPIRWHTEGAQIRTSDRMSNPPEWYVTDAAINEGFTAAATVCLRRTLQKQRTPGRRDRPWDRGPLTSTVSPRVWNWLDAGRSQAQTTSDRRCSLLAGDSSIYISPVRDSGRDPDVSRNSSLRRGSTRS